MKEKRPTVQPTFGPVQRYSDKDLEEFRMMITQKLEEACSDFEFLRNTLSGKENNGTQDTAPTFNLAEDGTEVSSREEIAMLALRRQNYINQLRNALVRVQNKTYGICTVTGQLIAKERLKSVPHTTMSMNGKVGVAGRPN